jgi:transcriptional regulator with XRE-family HTH domain
MGADTDRIMLHIRAVFEKSGLSLEELGRRMGYEEDIARKSAWQFLNRTNDPRLSMLRRFTEAVGISMSDLFDGDREELV